MPNPRNNSLLTNARNLRKNMTPAERHLWYDFLRYCQPRFRRQEIIGSYIADFYCHKAKMIIEIDGSQHTEPAAMEYDSQRTRFMESLGILVVRYYNNDISKNFSGVCQDILTLLDARDTSPSVTFGDSSPKRGNNPSVTFGDSSPKRGNNPSVTFGDSSPKRGAGKGESL